MNANLSKETIDKMVEDACCLDAIEPDQPYPHWMVKDLCCHIKALACEVEILHQIIRDAPPWFHEGDTETHRLGGPKCIRCGFQLIDCICQ